MVRDLSSKLDDVKEDVRAGNVTLGWIAVGELDCPRLVFIFPAPRAEHRSLGGPAVCRQGATTSGQMKIINGQQCTSSS